MAGKRIGVFGWGIVAPGAANVDDFASVMAQPRTWLSPFEGFGPSNFLVGQPAFDMGTYRAWIDARFPPTRYPNLVKKFGAPTHYAVGAFIQALAQNAGVEAELRELGARAQVILGSGLTDLATYDTTSRDLDRAQRRWNRFWAQPGRNSALAAHLAGTAVAAGAPQAPDSAPEADRDVAEDAWWAYWASRSDGLAAYLDELRSIESMSLEGDVLAAKATVLKHKARAIRDLRAKWSSPEAPWDVVPADLLWNIASSPAAQISMLGHIRGMAFSPLAACSAFGFSLKLGMEAIRRGEADLVVVGASEPAPHPLSVGTFYNARVLAHDREVSKPLTGMRGAHVSGGAAVWVLGDLERYVARGWVPLGLEPVAVGVTSDADHIITPSKEGPVEAIRQALGLAGVSPAEVSEFDMHATGTPGDFNEVEVIREVMPSTCRLVARKGTFGHGMGAGGGWELTAQYLGHVRNQVFPTPTHKDEINPAISRLHGEFVLDEAVVPRPGWVAKLSMGVGGFNACVLSRPYE